ncbi:MAG TPA: hypothetical protein VMW83_06135 [Spirochaetia bacterium]|nr:hypothetical protein [Spirochaetia bacterium]
MPTTVTLKTGLWLGREEAAELKSKLAKLRYVLQVDVPFPDRVVITYENGRLGLSTLKAAIASRTAVPDVRVTRR